MSKSKEKKEKDPPIKNVDKSEKKKENIKLKINGSLDDVLKASVRN